MLTRSTTKIGNNYKDLLHLMERLCQKDVVELVQSTKESYHKALNVLVLWLSYHIFPNNKEHKDLLKDMNSILDWVEQLNEVNTDSIEPLANISSSILPQRKDESKDVNSSDEILQNSPDKLEGYFAVPKVVE